MLLSNSKNRNNKQKVKEASFRSHLFLFRHGRSVNNEILWIKSCLKVILDQRENQKKQKLCGREDSQTSKPCAEGESPLTCRISPSVSTSQWRQLAFDANKTYLTSLYHLSDTIDSKYKIPLPKNKECYASYLKIIDYLIEELQFIWKYGPAIDPSLTFRGYLQAQELKNHPYLKKPEIRKIVEKSVTQKKCLFFISPSLRTLQTAKPWFDSLFPKATALKPIVVPILCERGLFLPPEYAPNWPIQTKEEIQQEFPFFNFNFCGLKQKSISGSSRSILSVDEQTQTRTSPVTLKSKGKYQKEEKSFNWWPQEYCHPEIELSKKKRENSNSKQLQHSEHQHSYQTRETRQTRQTKQTKKQTKTSEISLISKLCFETEMDYDADPENPTDMEVLHPFLSNDPFRLMQSESQKDKENKNLALQQYQKRIQAAKIWLECLLSDNTHPYRVFFIFSHGGFLNDLTKALVSTQKCSFMMTNAAITHLQFDIENSSLEESIAKTLVELQSLSSASIPQPPSPSNLHELSIQEIEKMYPKNLIKEISCLVSSAPHHI